MGSHTSSLAAVLSTTRLVPGATSTFRSTSIIPPSTLTVTAVSIETLTPALASAVPLANTEPPTISVTTIITATIFTEPTPIVTPAVSVQAVSSPTWASVASVQASQPNGLATGNMPSSTISSAASRTASLLSAKGSAAAAAAALAEPALIPAQIETMKRVGRGPFAPPDAILGGIPTAKLDVPITVVFLVLFLIGAATHMTIYNINSKRGHKFILSDLFFDFCMVRTVTTTMRIVWAFRSMNNSVVLAALIFENAGVSVIFAINLVLTQRILRAIHPKIFWHPATSTFFTLLLVSVPFFIIFNIAVLTASFFVTTASGAKATKDLLFFGSSWNLFLCVFPLLTLSTFAVLPSPTPIEKFGTGRFRTKLVMLVYSSATLFIGAVVRLIAAAQSHPINDPGQVDTKTIFYLTGFMLEIFVVVLFAAARFDLRFHIPNGCTGPGQYSVPKEDDKEGLFQDVDVKMRMSYGSAQEISQSKGYGNGDINGFPISPGRWQDISPDRTNATREQVRQAIFDLKLKHDLVGDPIDSGDSELLVYAFRVRKLSGGGSDGSASPETGMRPRRPPRSSAWMGRVRSPGGGENKML